MNFATALLPGRVVDALGWTLFHSLWQGALAALAFALVLFITRQYSARVRYALGLMALLLVLAASLVTFFSYYNDPGAGVSPAVAVAAPTPAGETAPALPPAPATAEGERPAAARIVSFFTDYFGRNLPLFVTLWLLGVLFLTLRFTGGLLYIQRLKYRQNRPLPAPWPDRLLALAAKAGLRRPIQMLESLRLRAPVVVGHLKPVLLLPAGLVTGLPADEVEALLAHELAHVMRRDYLVNVLQHLLDILFFFHPGVRWISACVRQEREHCCDDFAVELSGDSRNYARALARLQVEGMAGLGAAQPALAAVGRPRLLLRRIARLLASPRLAHDFREGFVSALLLVVGLLGIMRMATAGGGPDRGTGAIDRALPAGGKPAQGAAPAAPASRFALVSFVLEADGLVRLSGEVRAPIPANRMPQPAGTWIVNDDDGQVVWYMDLSSPREKGASFREEVPLGRGAYSWYRPSGWKATAQWKKSGSGAWEPLTMFVGGREPLLLQRLGGDKLLQKERQEWELQKLEKELQARAEAERETRAIENRKRAEELRARGASEEELRKEEERRRAEELRAQDELENRRREYERQLREERQRQLAEELLAREEARKGMREHGLQQELAQAEAERAMSELERQKLEQERLMEMKARELKASEEGLLKEGERRLRAEELLLKEEEKRLKVLQGNLEKFTAALAAEGLIDLKKGYRVKLSLSSLVINGKTQPQKVLEKYRQLYEELVGNKLTKKNKITFVMEKE